MKVVFSLFITVIMISCGEPPAGNRFYFYQFDLNNEPKVYVYKNINNPDDVYYYAVKSIQADENKYLHLEISNSSYHILESQRMLINSEGAFAEEFLLYYDSINYQSLKIYADSVMIWDFKNNATFAFEASFNRPETWNQLIVKRIKHYNGKSENIEFEGANYKTIELVEDNFFNDGNDALKINRKILKFARGLGLIEFMVTEKGNSPQSYKLDKIININEWKILKSKV
jgi:hypothetical protein